MGLKPFLVLRRITELTPEWLAKNNIRGMLVDLDNTLTPYHSENIPEDIVAWITAIQESSIKFVPYSNAKLYRIRNFCERFGISNPGIALKPLNLGLGRALKALGFSKSEILLVGDQVFTDCLAGKFAGIRTVLVDPINRKEFPATQIMRRIERIVGRGRWKYDRLEI